MANYGFQGNEPYTNQLWENSDTFSAMDGDC